MAAHSRQQTISNNSNRGVANNAMTLSPQELARALRRTPHIACYHHKVDVGGPGDRDACCSAGSSVQTPEDTEDLISGPAAGNARPPPPVPRNADRDHPTAGRASTSEDNEADSDPPAISRKRRPKRQRVLPAWGALQLTCNPKLIPPCNFSDDERGPDPITQAVLKETITNKGTRQPPESKSSTSPPLGPPTTTAATAAAAPINRKLRGPRKGGKAAAARKKYRGWSDILDPELAVPRPQQPGSTVLQANPRGLGADDTPGDPGRKDAELCLPPDGDGLGCDSAAARWHTISSRPSIGLGPDGVLSEVNGGPANDEVAPLSNDSSRKGPDGEVHRGAAIHDEIESDNDAKLPAPQRGMGRLQLAFHVGDGTPAAQLSLETTPLALASHTWHTNGGSH